jgi:hypothetical protein
MLKLPDLHLGCGFLYRLEEDENQHYGSSASINVRKKIVSSKEYYRRAGE